MKNKLKMSCFVSLKGLDVGFIGIKSGNEGEIKRTSD
jgi:hypothetical protein